MDNLETPTGGSIVATDTKWTENGWLECYAVNNGHAHLYCLQQ
jgi:hypothetical protein